MSNHRFFRQPQWFQYIRHLGYIRCFIAKCKPQLDPVKDDGQISSDDWYLTCRCGNGINFELQIKRV